MLFHRHQVRFADDGETRLWAVLFDLMRTLVVPKVSYKHQLAKVYSEIAEISVEPQRAFEVTEEVRLRTVRTGNPADDWARINREILAILTGVNVEEILPEMAIRVRPQLMGNPDFCQVLPEMRALLERVAARVPIGLASNYEGKAVNHFLDHFDLRRYLRPEWIFVSDQMSESGRFMDKPTAGFWERVRAEVGFSENPRAIALVGDDWRTDAPAVRFGHPVALWGSSGSSDTELAAHPLLVVCNSAGEVEQTLISFGLPR